MSDQFYVDPDALRAAVTEVAAATTSLDGARTALTRAGNLVHSGIDHGGRADDKVSTFVRQWRSEYEIVADLLGGFGDVLIQAAACYEELEAAFVRGMT